MFDAVVVATDGSASGERAVRTALDLADRFDAAVHALSVIDTGRVAELPADAQDEAREELREQSEAAVAAVAADAPASATTAVRAGKPAEEIVAYAEEVDADAVAMGTRGRGGEGGFLLGSVAEAVVRTCERPVLTVRRGPEADGENAAEGD